MISFLVIDSGTVQVGLRSTAVMDAIAALDLAVGDGFDESGRDIHHDVALGEDEIHAEEPLERSFELLDAGADRHIERFQGLRTDRAGGIEPVAQLEMLDAFDHARVIGFAGFLIDGHVVGDDKALAQQRDVRAAGARLEFCVGRQRRPAAAHLDIGIEQQRLLDALEGAFVEYRVRRQRQLRGRARFRRTRRLDGCLRRFCRDRRFGGRLGRRAEALRQSRA
jgi:hypothetical protein